MNGEKNKKRKVKSSGVAELRQEIAAYKRINEALQQNARFTHLLFNMLNGFAYCRMLFEDGKPTDFIYIMVNHAFETLT